MKKKFLSCFMFLTVLCGAAHAQYDKDVFFMRGRTALSDGKYAQAIENFNILARLDTTDYWTFFLRGIAKYNLGDLRGAYNDFNSSVRINPVFTNGYHYRAVTRSRFGQYDEAIADLQHAIDLRPGYMGLYYSRGVTYFLAQRFPEAVQDFDRYIKREPKDAGAYLNRGACQLFLADTVKALSDYNKAIKIDRFDPEGFVRRGRVYAAQKKYDKAIADLDHAIEIDSTNTFAYFNRAIMHYETQNYIKAMSDLNRVLRDEPGNALTLYNRSLIHAQVGDYESALDDMDRVININPGNVLAYFNRASYFIELGRLRNALDDYTKAIELYPDFAKAYMNRSYVENLLGMTKASKDDYRTAQRKVAEYRANNADSKESLADTTRKYSSLLALDADFAKKDFDNELLQHRDIDIRLKPLYRFKITRDKDNTHYALSHNYEHPLIERFYNKVPLNLTIANTDSLASAKFERSLISILSGDSSTSAGQSNISEAQKCFIRGIYDVQNRQFTKALSWFDKAVESAEADNDPYAGYYKSFFLMNRAVLRAEMIEFIASMENNVQTLSMDDKGTIRARVNDTATHSYDYSEALEDIQEAVRLAPDIPYLWFNMGNLLCLSSQMVESIDSYSKAIELHPYMGDAYYNRGLVLIYLKDKEKGCIDLSRAGELGVADAYSVISKYCEKKND